MAGSTATFCPKLTKSIREEVIGALPETVVAEAMRELETDDLVDILEDLEAPAQDKILDALDDWPTGWRWNRRCPIRNTLPAA